MRAAPIPDGNPLEPGWRRVTFGPPKGMTEAQVYTHDALVGRVRGGALDGSPAIQMLVELEDGDLEQLQESGHLWLTLLTTALPPWSMAPAEMFEAGVCKVCGCTDDDACAPPCSWADADRTLCSACAEGVDTDG